MKKLKQKAEKFQKQSEEDSESLENQQEQLLQQNKSSQENEIVEETQNNTTFESLGVCAELCEACERLKYKVPTKIQQESLPYSLKCQDIIGLAETGSGKTLSFALPIIQALLDNPQPFFGLVIAPTRELSIQISEQFEAIGAGINLKSVVIVGGLDPMAQALALAKKPHVVIGTPGRLLYHLENTKGFSLKYLKYLVFDEADKLLDMDFEKEINQILEILPKDRNTFLFSATMTNKVSKLQKASLKSPVKVEVSSKYQTVSTLVQNYLFIPAKSKDIYLVYTLNEFAGNLVIVFVSTCMNSIRVCLMLRNLGFQAVTIHGQMSQAKRLAALTKFKSKERSILIATDVASRGLDIPSVDLVLNYDVPQHSKDYIHRVGRTARAGKAGRSITFVTQYCVENYQKIEHLIGKKLDLYKTEEENVMIFAERVQEAQRIASQEIKNLLEKKSKKQFSDDEDNAAADGGGNKINKLKNNNNMDKKKNKKSKFKTFKNGRKKIKFDI